MHGNCFFYIYNEGWSALTAVSKVSNRLWQWKVRGFKSPYSWWSLTWHDIKLLKLAPTEETEFTLSQSCPTSCYFSLPQLPQPSLTCTKRQPLLQKSFYPRPCAIPIWLLKYLFFPISHLMGPRISGLWAFYTKKHYWAHSLWQEEFWDDLRDLHPPRMAPLPFSASDFILIKRIWKQW